MDFDAEMNPNTCTELRLGLPVSTDKNPKPSDAASRPNKRDFSAASCGDSEDGKDNAPPPPKAQIVGWPPVRSYRKNIVKAEAEADAPVSYVKVSMDGAPYLRKIDLKIYQSYQELLKSLEEMFKFRIGDYSENKGSEYAPTYEDKDGDWMLVGDVPWNMFITSCKRLRIMKGAEARGLTCIN